MMEFTVFRSLCSVKLKFLLIFLFYQFIVYKSQLVFVYNIIINLLLCL